MPNHNQKENNHKISSASIDSANQDPVKPVFPKGHNNKEKGKKRVFKRIGTFLINKDNQPIIANAVSISMFLATAFLAYYTWRVFNQTIIQTKVATESADAAKISADAAKQSADLQKLALDSQFSAKKQSDIADAAKLKRDTDFINKQKKAIDAQIAAIHEAKNEFEIGHSPYITVEGLQVAGRDSVEINVGNEGTQMAIMLGIKGEIKAEKYNKIKRMVQSPDEVNDWLPVNKHGGSAVSLLSPGKNHVYYQSIPDTDMNEVRLRKKIIYMRIIIYYFNITKNKPMAYESILKWNPRETGFATIYFGYRVLKKYPE